jgi:hypothetical protein
MQKVYDLPYVPPIDVPTGAETDILELKERYWTIFQTPLFHERIAEMAKGK